MSKMVRKQVFITAEQKLLIKMGAALTGVSQAEIIRRGIDRELEQAPPATPEPRQHRRTRRKKTRKLVRGEVNS